MINNVIYLTDIRGEFRRKLLYRENFAVINKIRDVTENLVITFSYLDKDLLMDIPHRSVVWLYRSAVRGE